VRGDDPDVARWDIQVAGHLCIDLVPRLLDAADVTPGRLVRTGPLDMRLGGCVGNTGPDLAALGLRTVLVTALGDDALATMVATLIDAAPGADHRIEIVPGATTSYSVVVQPPGTDRSFWHHVGSNAAFDGRQVDVHVAPLLHVGYLPLLPRLTEHAGAGLVRLLQEARSAAVTTSIDMSVTQPGTEPVDWADLLTRALPLCDVVSPSLDDMRSALGRPGLGTAEAAGWLLARGAAVVMVSDGPQGLVVRTAAASRFAGADGTTARSRCPRRPGPWCRPPGPATRSPQRCWPRSTPAGPWTGVWSWCGRPRPIGLPGWGRWPRSGASGSPRDSVARRRPGRAPRLAAGAPPLPRPRGALPAGPWLRRPLDLSVGRARAAVVHPVGAPSARRRDGWW